MRSLTDWLAEIGTPERPAVIVRVTEDNHEAGKSPHCGICDDSVESEVDELAPERSNGHAGHRLIQSAEITIHTESEGYEPLGGEVGGMACCSSCLAEAKRLLAASLPPISVPSRELVASLKRQLGVA